MRKILFNLGLASLLAGVTSACGEPETVTVEADPTPSSSFGGLFGGDSGEPLPADEVFVPGLFAQNSRSLEIDIRILPGHYVYKDKIEVRSLTNNAVLGILELPEGVIKTDEWFGEQEVYFDEVFGSVPVNRNEDVDDDMTIELTYQGCKEDGICYLPVSKELTVTMPARVAYPLD